MLRWPSPERLTPAARANLERFRATSAARDLETDGGDWSFEKWSWQDAPELRFIVRNAQQESRAYVVDTDHTWRMDDTEVKYTAVASEAEPADVAAFGHAVEEENEARRERSFATRLRHALHPQKRTFDAPR